MINRANYESFFLDYLEKRLEEKELDELLVFLRQNPDLEAELKQYENIQLPPEEVAFWGKNSLYKSDEVSFERKLIALMEGDLEDNEQESFKYHIAGHPELQEEYNLLYKSRLIADTGIKYPDKQKLYKNPRTFKLTNRIAGAAAAVLLISIGVHSLFQTRDRAILPPTNKEALLIAIPQSGNVAETSNAQAVEKLSAPTKVKVKEIVQTNSNPASINDTIILSSLFYERDSMVPQKLKPVETLLETAATANELAVSCPVHSEKPEARKDIAAVEKYLATCVKKAGDESISSVNRIIRTGLNVATELSGNRIGYQVKDGKISSIELETKLVAFTIPLQKN